MATLTGTEKTDSMGTKYHVRFTGHLQNGLSQEDVVKNLGKLTTLGQTKAEALLSAGKPLILKKNLDLEAAKKYRRVFEKAGMVIQIAKTNVTESTGAVVEKPKPAQPAQPISQTSPSPAASGQLQGEKNIAENPYAAPKADLKVKKEVQGKWHEHPQKVPASHGWYWLKSAISMFFEHPWIWMGMWLILFLTIIVLKMIPLIGPLCSGLLSAVLTGGLMMAAQSQTEGEQVKISHVFRGFTHNRNQLLLVGLYYILVFISFGVVIGLFMGFGTLFGFRSGDQAAMAALMRQNMPLLLSLVLIMSLLVIPLMMCYWFAPALAALADKTAWNAYKMSFRGCLKNWAAFLIYGLAVLVVGILIMIAFSAVSGIFFVFVSQGGSFLTAFIPVILVVLLGVPIASILGLAVFTGFRDIYYQAN